MGLIDVITNVTNCLCRHQIQLLYSQRWNAVVKKQVELCVVVCSYCTQCFLRTDLYQWGNIWVWGYFLHYLLTVLCQCTSWHFVTSRTVYCDVGRFHLCNLSVQCWRSAALMMEVARAIETRWCLIIWIKHTHLLWLIRKFNLLKTKRNLLYIRNQSVPRCKHFPPRL